MSYLRNFISNWDTFITPILPQAAIAQTIIVWTVWLEFSLHIRAVWSGNFIIHWEINAIRVYRIADSVALRLDWADAHCWSGALLSAYGIFTWQDKCHWKWRTETVWKEQLKIRMYIGADWSGAFQFSKGCLHQFWTMQQHYCYAHNAKWSRATPYACGTKTLSIRFQLI